MEKTEKEILAEQKKTNELLERILNVLTLPRGLSGHGSPALEPRPQYYSPPLEECCICANCSPDTSGTYCLSCGKRLMTAPIREWNIGQ